MTVSSSQIRTWSMLGQRGVFGATLLDLALKNDRIWALSADLCNTSGFDRFQAQLPERFLNVGIAEQNLIGVAAGLASCGKIPFATTFANFATLRACEFVRHFMGYMNENVKLVGFGAGFAMGMFGNTHYGLEDVAALRAINNLTILSPADGFSVVKAVHAAVELAGPVYLRLSGTMSCPSVYRNDFDFCIGKANRLRHGKDISILATGMMVSEALKTANFLEADGINASVYDFHTIKPIDVEAILEASHAGMLVVIEEHSRMGGLASAVSEVLVTRALLIPKVISIGTDFVYHLAGSYDFMQRENGLKAEQITQVIKKELKND